MSVLMPVLAILIILSIIIYLATRASAKIITESTKNNR